MALKDYLIKLVEIKKNIKDAIEKQTQKTISTDFKTYADLIKNLDTSTTLEKFLRRTLEQYKLPENVEIIHEYQFAHQSSLKELQGIENITIIDDYGLAYSPLLTTLQLPKLKTLGQYAFMQCTKLKKVISPLLTTIPKYAFYMTNLDTFDFSKITSIAESAFAQCKFKTLNLPQLTHVLLYVFAENKELEEVNMPLVKLVSTGSFSDCSKLVKVIGSNIININNAAFANCKNLSIFDFSAYTKIDSNRTQYIGNNAFENTGFESVTFHNLTDVTVSFAFQNTFKNCKNLKHIYFPKLTNINSTLNIFYQTLEGVTDCTIHFPTSLESTLPSSCSALNNIGGVNTQILYDLDGVE